MTGSSNFTLLEARSQRLGGLFMERFELLGWVVEVDAAQTAAYYARHTQCSCAYCQNLIATMERWPLALREALSRMGVNLRQEGEIMELGPEADGLRLYRVGCPVVGRLISKPASAPYCWPGGNYTFWFSANPHEYPVYSDLPAPVLFACITARVPWVLQEQLNPPSPSRGSRSPHGNPAL